jgi:hypothetical protein
VQDLNGSGFVLSYDRETGQADCTVEQFLANTSDDCGGDYHETFHFALNNYVAGDNRIPPYKMSYTEAKKRNALPVPDNRYTRFGTNGDSYYEHQDDVQLSLSSEGDAVYATIDLLYQGTSWEYILFLQMANDGANAFLGNQGDAMMDAWLNADVVQSTGAPITSVQMINDDYKMVPPVLMASAEWGAPPVCNATSGQEAKETSCNDGIDNDCDGFTDASDSDCALVCVPTGSTEADCDDSLDNDCDGLFDCDDSDCDLDPACQAMACSGYADKGSCQNDSACVWQGSPKNGMCDDAAVCKPTESTEVSCTGGVDNDCDGAIDCADSDCSGDSACENMECSDLGRRSCNAEATCSWSGKTKTCNPI